MFGISDKHSPQMSFFLSFVISLKFTLGPLLITLYMIYFRNCIGMQFALTQIKVIIPMIVRNFHLDLDPERPAEPESMLILRSKNGLYLKATPI